MTSDGTQSMLGCIELCWWFDGFWLILVWKDTKRDIQLQNPKSKIQNIKSKIQNTKYKRSYSMIVTTIRRGGEREERTNSIHARPGAIFFCNNYQPILLHCNNCNCGNFARNSQQHWPHVNVIAIFSVIVFVYILLFLPCLFCHIILKTIFSSVKIISCHCFFCDYFLNSLGTIQLWESKFSNRTS